MKLLSLITSIILWSNPNFAQISEISESKLDSLYIETIQNQLLFIQGGTFYLEKNERNNRIYKNETLEYLVLMSNEELIEESLKTKKTLNQVRVTHKVISKDTIDINIGYLSVTAKRGIFLKNGIKFKKTVFELSCGGTNGYVPARRFIYDKTNRKWE